MMLKKYIRLMEREAAYMGPFGITKTGQSNYFLYKVIIILGENRFLSLYNIAFASIFCCCLSVGVRRFSLDCIMYAKYIKKEKTRKSKQMNLGIFTVMPSRLLNLIILDEDTYLAGLAGRVVTTLAFSLNTPFIQTAPSD
jgi:hypothetical protein